MKFFVAVCLLSVVSCMGRLVVAPLPPLPFAVDSARSHTIAEGVTHRYLYAPKGPWAINVLDIDLDKCNAAIAVKGVDSAAGRLKTSTMLSSVATRSTVVGGVNADFFSLANGTPTGLLVVEGRMLTPPTTAPVLAFDSSGVPRIAVFTRNGNSLRPFYPLNAVGGRPVLVRDSLLTAVIDSAGGAAFAAARHPRTAAGIAQGGRRLMLVEVDGRQLPYSDGMTLRELGTLMMALGSRDAINLDGGGSSVLLYADPDQDKALRIANRPSDKEGERAVGDALAIIKRCQRGR